MMRWYYKVMGTHTHVRVFMNGGKCGDLVFRNTEFQDILEQHAKWHHNYNLWNENTTPLVEFVSEDVAINPILRMQMEARKEAGTNKPDGEVSRLHETVQDPDKQEGR